MTRTIDYAGANRMFGTQKAALTRAVKSKDPEKIEQEVRKAVSEWNSSEGPFFGAWPDDWARWQRALDDSRPWNAPHIDIDIYSDIR